MGTLKKGKGITESFIVHQRLEYVSYSTSQTEEYMYKKRRTQKGAKLSVAPPVLPLNPG